MFCNIPTVRGLSNQLLRAIHLLGKRKYRIVCCTWLTLGSFLVDRYLLLGGQVSIAWRTGIYCLAHRYLLLGGQLGRYLHDLENQQLTNQITELWHAWSTVCMCNGNVFQGCQLTKISAYVHHLRNEALKGSWFVCRTEKHFALLHTTLEEFSLLVHVQYTWE